MISLEQLSALLDAARQPFGADFEGDLDGESPARYLQLYVYVHRVQRSCPRCLSLLAGARTTGISAIRRSESCGGRP